MISELSAIIIIIIIIHVIIELSGWHCGLYHLLSSIFLGFFFFVCLLHGNKHDNVFISVLVLPLCNSHLPPESGEF